jgi:hypothetical protein
MAAINVSVEVPAQAIEEFGRACNRYRDELGNRQAVAVRRGTIALVKSLRARTRKAKKVAPAQHIIRSEKPRYLTPKGHNQKPQRAWNVRRRVGSEREKTYLRAAASKAEARRNFAKYTRWGLARQSWGWFLQALFSRAMPSEGNPKAKVDSRMANGYLREVVSGKNPRVEVLIVNKLDYIRDALPAHALEESMRAATNSINKQIDAGLAKARKEME